jgi:hypothetical protein
MFRRHVGRQVSCLTRQAVKRLADTVLRLRHHFFDSDDGAFRWPNGALKDNHTFLHMSDITHCRAPFGIVHYTTIGCAQASDAADTTIERK